MTLKKLINFINIEVVKDPSIVVSENTKLFADKLVDSINILFLIGFIEKNTNKKISNSDLNMKNFATPQTMYTYFFEKET